MKKLIYLIIIMFILPIFLTIPSFAVTVAPVYDERYNNSAGALYANGNDIIIDTDEQDRTVVKWWGGSQIVPKSVTIFGGGVEGTTYTNSNMIMNDGEIFCIVSGGVSKEKARPTRVDNATITINGGTVSGNVVGGGYLYSEVGYANLIINSGNVEAVIGGGFATIMIDSKIYNVGSATDLKASENRVDKVDITINDIVSPPTEMASGIIYGGGNGYAYVGESNITINDGDMSKAYVIAGGVDGYVGKANVTIAGGTISSYQSANNGMVDSVTTKITGGTIGNFFVGAEKDNTGGKATINEATVYLLDGNITKLMAGSSNSLPLEIDGEQYKVFITDEIDIQNNTIPIEKQILLTYKLALSPVELFLTPNASEQINATVTTIPEGYEEFFKDTIKWQTNDEKIATVSDDGIVTGVNYGTAEITATFLKDTEVATVTVERVTAHMLMWIVIIAILTFIIILVTIFG